MLLDRSDFAHLLGQTVLDRSDFVHLLGQTVLDRSDFVHLLGQSWTGLTSPTCWDKLCWTGQIDPVR